MSRVPGCPLSQLRAGSLVRSEVVYETCLQILVRLAEHGLVHCDLNEFNLMLDPAAAATASAEQLDQVAVTIIDFPQMVSCSHPNAEEFFQRDLKGLRKFFATKMRCPAAMLARVEVSEEEQEEGQEEGEGEGNWSGGRPGCLTLAAIAESSRSRRLEQAEDLAAEALAALTAEEQVALESFLDESRRCPELHLDLDLDLDRDTDTELEVQDDNDGELSGHGADGGGPAQEEKEGEEEREEDRGRDGTAAEKAKAGALFRCVAAAVGIEAEEQEQEQEEKTLRQGGSSDGLEEQRQADAVAGVSDRLGFCILPHARLLTSLCLQSLRAGGQRARPRQGPGQGEGPAVARQPKHDQENQ